MSGPMILIAVGLVVLIFFLGYRVGYESRRMEMWDVNEAAAKAEEAQECVAEAALEYIIAESAVGESASQWDALVRAVRDYGAMRGATETK